VASLYFRLGNNLPPSPFPYFQDLQAFSYHAEPAVGVEHHQTLLEELRKNIGENNPRVLHIQASGKNHQIPREEGKLTRHPELVSGVLCKTGPLRRYAYSLGGKTPQTPLGKGREKQTKKQKDANASSQ